MTPAHAALPEELLDVNQAARLARRSPETVRRWVWSGKLAAQRRGRRLMIARSDLEALVPDHGGAGAVVILAEWAEKARQALASSERPRGSAVDLILADRLRRSELPSGQ